MTDTTEERGMMQSGQPGRVLVAAATASADAPHCPEKRNTTAASAA